MLAAAEGGQDAAGVGLVGGFADDLTIQPAHGVRSQDNSLLHPGRDYGSLGPGDGLHIGTWIGETFASGFVDMSGHNVEGESGAFEQFAAGGGATGQD